MYHVGTSYWWIFGISMLCDSMSSYTQDNYGTEGVREALSLKFHTVRGRITQDEGTNTTHQQYQYSGWSIISTCHSEKSVGPQMAING